MQVGMRARVEDEDEITLRSLQCTVECHRTKCMDRIVNNPMCIQNMNLYVGYKSKKNIS